MIAPKKGQDRKIAGAGRVTCCFPLLLVLTGAQLVGALLLLALIMTGYHLVYRHRLKRSLMRVREGATNAEYRSLRDELAKKELMITEKELLLKELHHRVKNNLQIVMSILAGQFTLPGNSSREVLTDSYQKVMAISLIHQRLSIDESGIKMNMNAYICDLVNELARAFGLRERGIRFKVMAEATDLDITQAVAVGLIINEAITNAIKYAFDEDGGYLIVAFRRKGTEQLLLNVNDSGKGLPEPELVTGVSNLGLKMIRGLSRQLGGTLKLDQRRGLKMSIEFPYQQMSADLLHQ